MFKRGNIANAVFRRQPEGLESVFAHFYVARRSFNYAKPLSSRLELHKNVTSGDTNNVETASILFTPIPFKVSCTRIFDQDMEYSFALKSRLILLLAGRVSRH